MRVADYDSIASGGYEARYRLFEHRGIEDAPAAMRVVAQHVVSAVAAEQARADGQLERSFTSQLMILGDEEYDRGVRRLRDDIGRASARGLPLMLRSDLYIWATTGWKPERTAAHEEGSRIRVGSHDERL